MSIILIVALIKISYFAFAVFA